MDERMNGCLQAAPMQAALLKSLGGESALKDLCEGVTDRTDLTADETLHWAQQKAETYALLLH